MKLFPADFKEILRQNIADLSAINENEIDFICDLLSIYDNELLAYNSHTNLISKNSLNNRLERHYGDSLQLIDVIINEIKGLKLNSAILTDIGTGAGFPGIIIYISSLLIIKNAKLDLFHVKLIESISKKCRFLELVNEKIINCDNSKLSIINDRIENCRIKSNLITARALAPIDKLLQYQKIIEKNSKMKNIGIYLKGENIADEMKNFSNINIKQYEIGKIPIFKIGKYDIRIKPSKFNSYILIVS